MLSYQSEVGKLFAVILHEAERAFVSQEKIDTEWQQLNYVSLPNYKKAASEYSFFKNVLANTRG